MRLPGCCPLAGALGENDLLAVARTLGDGRSYRVVKRFYEPDELARELVAYGIDATVTTTKWAFLLGRGHG